MKVIDETVEVLRSLPENVQATVARAMIECVSHCEDQHADT
jgi:hypothetical protein